MAGEAQQLESFVKESLQCGKARGDVVQALQEAGWPNAQIRAALEAFADVAFPVPLPKPRPSLSARDAFLYLVMFSTLYYGAWNLGSLLFSGSLYAMALGAPHWLGAVTPLGGLLFMAGWAMLAWAAGEG